MVRNGHSSNPDQLRPFSAALSMVFEDYAVYRRRTALTGLRPCTSILLISTTVKSLDQLVARPSQQCARLFGRLDTRSVGLECIVGDRDLGSQPLATGHASPVKIVTI